MRNIWLFFSFCLLDFDYWDTSNDEQTWLWDGTIKYAFEDVQTFEVSESNNWFSSYYGGIEKPWSQIQSNRLSLGLVWRWWIYIIMSLSMYVSYYGDLQTWVWAFWVINSLMAVTLNIIMIIVILVRRGMFSLLALYFLPPLD